MISNACNTCWNFKWTCKSTASRKCLISNTCNAWRNYKQTCKFTAFIKCMSTNTCNTWIQYECSCKSCTSEKSFPEITYNISNSDSYIIFNSSPIAESPVITHDFPWFGWNIWWDNNRTIKSSTSVKRILADIYNTWWNYKLACKSTASIKCIITNFLYRFRNV